MSSPQDEDDRAGPSSLLPTDDYTRVRKPAGASRKGNFFSRLFKRDDVEYSRIQQSRTEQQQPKTSSFFSRLIDRAAASFKKPKNAWFFASARRIWNHITGNDETDEEYLLRTYLNRPPTIADTISDLDSESGLDPEDAPNYLDAEGNFCYRSSNHNCVVKLRISHSPCIHDRDEQGRLCHKGLGDETIINLSPHEQVYNNILTALVLNRNADKAIKAAEDLNKNILEAIVEAKMVNDGSWKELEEDEAERGETLGASFKGIPKLELERIEIASQTAVCQDRCGMFTIERVRRSSITPPSHVAALKDEIDGMDLTRLDFLGCH